MSKMIQIRHVPDDVHRTLKARAAQAGMSLSDYLRAEITELASLPTMDEWIERVRSREPVLGGDSSEDAIRAIREERDPEWGDAIHPTREERDRR